MYVSFFFHAGVSQQYRTLLCVSCLLHYLIVALTGAALHVDEDPAAEGEGGEECLLFSSIMWIWPLRPRVPERYHMSSLCSRHWE